MLRRPDIRPGAWQFALATTLSALLAMAAAIALGMLHPWWAAMAVWLVAQPTRGLLIERSVVRLVGSGVGAMVGYGLLIACAHAPYALLATLTLWIGLCCGAGALFRHFRNYGFVLAGWTAAIVALFGLGDTSQRAALALDRVGATVLGVLAVTLTTAALIPASKSALVADRLHFLVGKTLGWLTGGAAFFQQRQEGGEALNLLAEIGALESAIDEAAAGSLHGRATASSQRAELAAMINLLAMERRFTSPAQWNAANPQCLLQAEKSIQSSGSEPGVKTSSGRLAALAAAFPDKPTLIANCATLARTMDRISDADRPPRTRQWRDASVASLRAMLTVSLASGLWWVTGWNEAPVLVMTAALFACLFSGNDHAITAINDVLKGSVYGALLGIACRLWVWPWAVTPTLQLLSITPFLLLGAYLMARPGTAKMAIDLNMTFLLITRPGFQQPIATYTVVMQAIAIIGGVLIALSVYHLVIPASRNAKLASVARRMARRLETIGKHPDRLTIDDLRPVTADVLRLGTLGDRTPRDSGAVQEQALTALGEACALADANANPQQHPCRDTSLSAQRLVGYAAALREAAQVLSSPARPWRNT